MSDTCDVGQVASLKKLFDTCYINRVKTRRNMYVIWLSHLNLPQIGYYVPRFISEIHRTLMASHEIWSPKRVEIAPALACPFVPGEIHQDAHVGDAR